MSVPSPDSPAAGYARVLGEATATLDRSGIPHVVFGSIALRALGRPRPAVPDEDIDLMIRAPDASPALEALADEGFGVEETDPS